MNIDGLLSCQCLNKLIDANAGFQHRNSRPVILTVFSLIFLNQLIMILDIYHHEKSIKNCGIKC